MNENRYELFDKYLNNELNIDEKSNFENQLKSDSEFAEAFEIFKDLNGYMANKFENEIQVNSFKENLQVASLESKEANKPKVFSIKPIYYAVAACFAIVFGLMIFNNSSVPNYEDFKQFETAEFTQRGDIIKDMKLAQDAYNSKKYLDAAHYFETILKTYSSVEIEYYYGICLLETNKYFEAEIVFKKLKMGQSIFKTKATYNLALLKLKQKDYQSCKEILKTIPQDFEDYDQVQKLMNSLD